MPFLSPPPPHPLLPAPPPPPADPPTLEDLEAARDFRLGAEKAARLDREMRPQFKQALIYEQRISLAMDPDLLVERRAIEAIIDARIEAATNKMLEDAIDRVVANCLKAMHIRVDEKLASLEESLRSRIETLSSRIDALEEKLAARLDADVGGRETEMQTLRYQTANERHERPDSSGELS